MLVDDVLDFRLRGDVAWNGGWVTFKLHQCYPESRYIIADTSAVPMAPMMSMPDFPATAGLAAAGATLLTTRAEVDDLVESGALELFVGTPDTGGRGFVLNCPAPIVAPNDFRLA